jgi:hypothetical protein|tara:strand:- start:5297 stop:6382 length:1086 start_codon:yes stop_codon:yes gene_type:complete
MIIVTSLTKLHARAIKWTVHWALKLLFAPFKLIWLFAKHLALAFLATPGILWRVPVKMYRGLVKGRNWLLDKVTYLEQESQKWKTTFMMLKSPYTLLIKMGFTPNMAVSLLIGTSAVTGGVVVNETILTEKSFARGDSGQYVTDTSREIPVVWDEQFNTLRVDIGATAIKELTIDSVSIGDIFAGSVVNSTTVIDVGGRGDVDTWLEIGHLIFEKNRCDTLLLTSIQTNELLVSGNVSDGQSLAMGAGSHIPRNVTMGHHSSVMSTTSGMYDRIQISPPTSGTNGQVDTLRISNAYTRGGGCWLHRIKAGKVSIIDNLVGEGDGLANKDLQIENSVTATSITNNNNVEFVVALPATLAADS